MIDPKRKNAAFIWATQFYGNLIDLPVPANYQELWKEHILSLAYLCQTTVASKHTAESAIEAYTKAKEMLKIFDEKHPKHSMNRWSELDPKSAAGGDSIAIYKFLVLLFHTLSSVVDDYISESQEFLVEKNIEAPFIELLRDVNSDGPDWWQGTTQTPKSPTAATASSPASNSFSKFLATDISSTPSTSYLRKRSKIPISPIHNALHSPITVKIRQEEYKRMRERIVECEHLQDLLNLEKYSIQKEAERHKESAHNWREKFEIAEKERNLLESERNELVDNIDKLKLQNELAIAQGREHQSKDVKQSIEMEQVRKKIESLYNEKEQIASAKNSLERQYKDLVDENNAIYEAKQALESANSRYSEEVDSLKEQLQSKEKDIDGMRLTQRKAIKEKEDEYLVMLSRETDIRLDIQKRNDELTSKANRLKSELNEANILFSQKLDENREEFDRQRRLIEETNNELREQCNKLTQMIFGKDEQISNLQEKNLCDTDIVHNLSTENKNLRTSLQHALEQTNSLNNDKSRFITQITQLQSENEELKRKSEQRSIEIQQTGRRIEELEKEFNKIQEDIATNYIDTALAHKLSEPEYVDTSLKENETNKEKGQNLDHLDLDVGDDDGFDYVMTTKSVLGIEGTIVPTKEREVNFSTDRERLAQLNHRNSIQPAHLQCSYATELIHYNSPSGFDSNIRPSFSIPPPSPQPSRTSFSTTISGDKENASLFSAPVSAKKTRRLSSISSFFKVNKHN